jgi:hypothetical protein
MTSETPNPESSQISGLARTVLKIAWKDGRRSQLAENAALRLSLDAVVRLVQACRDRNASSLSKLTGERELPGNFLVFMASLSWEIDLKIQWKPNSSQPEETQGGSSDYDHAIFLALAQTIANVVWPESGKRNFQVPGIDSVLTRIGRSDERELQISLLQNYLANLMQDYLDRSQARVAVRDAPPEIEMELRRTDCRIVAELASQLASAENLTSPAESIQAGLGRAIDRLVRNTSV